MHIIFSIEPKFYSLIVENLQEIFLLFLYENISYMFFSQKDFVVKIEFFDSIFFYSIQEWMSFWKVANKTLPIVLTLY